MEEYTKKKPGYVSVISFVFLVIVIVIVIGLRSGGVLEYMITETEDISYAGTPHMVYRVVVKVEEIPLKEELEKTAIEIWENGNKEWNEFTVFMYLPDMDTGLVAYGVADFRPEGLKEFRIEEAALYGTKWESQKKGEAG